MIVGRVSGHHKLRSGFTLEGILCHHFHGDSAGLIYAKGDERWRGPFGLWNPRKANQAASLLGQFPPKMQSVICPIRIFIGQFLERPFINLSPSPHEEPKEPRPETKALIVRRVKGE